MSNSFDFANRINFSIETGYHTLLLIVVFLFQVNGPLQILNGIAVTWQPDGTQYGLTE